MLQKWNKIFVMTCVMAIYVDPLFFYIPVIVGKEKCVDLDEALQTTASVLRTFFNLFYILRIIFQFRTGFIAPFSLVFGRGELVDDPIAIMKRYLSSHFIIDILSILPLAQIIVLAIIPHMKKSAPFVAKDLLKYTVLIQYVSRLLRIRPLFKEVTRTSGILTETAWAGAAYNLFLFMLASHIVGANWYIFSVESQVRCWRREMNNNASSFHESYLGCGRKNEDVFTLLNSTCLLVDPDNVNDTKTFNYGIFFDALQSGVVDSTTSFPQKFFYCFWWGLRNLRSYWPQWKTWGACFIQAAWRRYSKKKIERTLREEEDKLQDALANEEGSTISLGATIYASRFAANALRNLRENNRHNRVPQRLMPLLPPKPAEPDFTTQKD